MVLSSRFFSFITLKHNRSGSSTRLFSLFIFTTFISGYQQLFGQSTFAATDPFQAYYDARQWFSEGNYGLSYPVFKDLERKISSRELPDRSVQYDEVLFYTLACELMQDNIGAERHAQAYLAGNVSSAYKGQMGYYLGTHYFRKQQYAEAIEAFGHSTAENLSPAQRSEMQFVLGYSLLTQRKFKEAKAQLNEVRDKPDSRHYVDANYYYGLLAYNDGQYREALRCFEIAGTSSVYQPLAPYYTASIQYALGNKAKGLELAEAALKSGNQFYELELNQLIGHAYFEKGDYRTATPFLEKYVNGSAKVNRADLYELAYCYYQL
ncbi:MAG TPA: tetratricopeptide repeat protein, partial [Phnomibacter sp.]|nr:tetratricopeptide repeat protein [Phnomibacter sp.]